MCFFRAFCKGQGTELKNVFGVANFQIFFGMPEIPYILNKSENATLQISIFCGKVLGKKYLVSLIMFPRHPANDSTKLHQFVSFDETA